MGGPDWGTLVRQPRKTTLPFTSKAGKRNQKVPGARGVQ